MVTMDDLGKQKRALLIGVVALPITYWLVSQPWGCSLFRPTVKDFIAQARSMRRGQIEARFGQPWRVESGGGGVNNFAGDQVTYQCSDGKVVMTYYSDPPKYGRADEVPGKIDAY